MPLTPLHIYNTVSENANEVSTMFNRSEIMQSAWVRVRKANVARFGLRIVLRNALRAAWNEAKQALRMARLAAAQALPKGEAARIRHAIYLLECKDRWGQADYRRHDELTADLWRAAA